MDYESYLELQKHYPRRVCNDYLLPAELKKRLSSGTVSVCHNELALLLFEQRKGFKKLHFRLIDESALIPAEEQTIAAFVTYREDHFPKVASRWLLAQRFEKTKTLQRFTASEITGEQSFDGVDFASAEEAIDMLGKYFSEVELDMPILDHFEGALCIRNRNGEPIGMLYMGQPLVVAVCPESRGQGLGPRLYRAFALLKSRKSGKSVFHEWISPGNSSSIAMFSKLGFTPDKVFTDCYVRS